MTRAESLEAAFSAVATIKRAKELLRQSQTYENCGHHVRAYELRTEAINLYEMGDLMMEEAFTLERSTDAEVEGTSQSRVRHFAGRGTDPVVYRSPELCVDDDGERVREGSPELLGDALRTWDHVFDTGAFDAVSSPPDPGGLGGCGCGDQDRSKPRTIGYILEGGGMGGLAVEGEHGVHFLVQGEDVTIGTITNTHSDDDGFYVTAAIDPAFRHLLADDRRAQYSNYYWLTDAEWYALRDTGEHSDCEFDPDYNYFISPDGGKHYHSDFIYPREDAPFYGERYNPHFD